MPRKVKIGLVQAQWEGDVQSDDQIRQGIEQTLEKHERFVKQAADQGVQILCFQELFFGPYFAAEQDRRWFKYAEPIPGPVTKRFAALARKYRTVVILPIFEIEAPGVYYNTSVVIDTDGEIVGIYRKSHIPHQPPGYWEKFYFRPGNLGYPVFETEYALVGVYTCYDRHFPEGARILGLNGAEIVFNPSATTRGHSDHLWTLEQSAHAVANGYYVAAINRIGDEPWGIGYFYGSSYIVNPKGEIVVQGPDDREELVVAEVDLDLIREVKDYWPFFRDRRPDTYDQILEP